MDPDATLHQIDDFLAAHKPGEEVDAWCRNLWKWISRGGFEPNWDKYPLGTSYYLCRKVHMDKGE
jgi:hypothetical protein